jgi:hypothetical protein
MNFTLLNNSLRYYCSCMLYCLEFFFFFFFWTCPRKGRGMGIRTCDLRFIKRGSQPIELSLGDKFDCIKK